MGINPSVQHSSHLHSNNPPRTSSEILAYLQTLQERHNGMPYYAVNFSTTVLTFAGPWSSEELQGLHKVYHGFDPTARLIQGSLPALGKLGTVADGVCDTHLQLGLCIDFPARGGWSHATLAALDFLETQGFELVSTGNIGMYPGAHSTNPSRWYCGSVLLRKKPE